MFKNKTSDLKNMRDPVSNYCSKCGDLIEPDYLFCQSCGSRVSSQVVHKSVPPVAPSYSTTDDSSRLQTFKSYIQIIGIVEIVFGILALLGGFVLAFMVPLIYEFLEYEDPSSYISEYDLTSYQIMDIITPIFIGLALLLFIYGIVSIVAGKKLLQYQNSGRIATMIIGALNLFNIPIGTVFGVAALYVLTQPEVEQLYTRGY